MKTVKLTPAQYRQAEAVGRDRREQSAQHGGRHKYGYSPDPVQALFNDVMAAAAELAASVALGETWPASVNTFKAEPDIPPDWEVRWRSSFRYEMLVRPDDPDQRRYIHVTGAGRQYAVIGWIRGELAKSPEFLREYANRPPAYFVPLQYLEPMNGITCHWPAQRVVKALGPSGCCDGAHDVVIRQRPGVQSVVCGWCDNFQRFYQWNGKATK